MPEDPRAQVIITADGLAVQVKNPAWCPACRQEINRLGRKHFPVHYHPDTTVMIECEGTYFTPEEVGSILADRQEQTRPGRYVRPHP